MWTVTRIDNPVDIGAIFDDWNQLARENRMRSASWGQAWWKSFADRCVPYVLVVRNEMGVQGVFPLALERSTFRGRRLILIGSGKACGDDLGILAAPGTEKQVVHALTNWLLKAKGSDAWDSLDLDGIQPSNTLMAEFHHQMESICQSPIQIKPSLHCWAIDVSIGWDNLLTDMSKRMRRLVKNSLIKDYIETGRARLKVAASLEEAHAMLKVTESFHQARWSEKHVDGCFATKGFGDFLETIVECWWATGIAYVATLELDGKPAAGVIGMWGPNELAMYLVGMDIDVQEHRPGWLLSVESIQLAIKLGKRQVNFLRGDEEYKARLGATPTVQQRWIVTSPGLIPQLRGAALRKGIEVRDWFRNRIKAVDQVAASPSLTDAST